MQDLKHHVIRSKNFLNPSSNALVNQTYQLWRDQWQDIYRQQNSDHAPAAEDFLRYDYISCLQSGSEIVGMSAHTFYNLEQNLIYDSEFFEMFGEKFIHDLRRRGITHIASFESLLVHPGYRKNKWSLPMGILLIHLGNIFFGTTNSSALIATARKDLKVSEIAQSAGYVVLQQDQSCRGFPCDLIAQFDKNFQLTSNDVWKAAQSLWSQHEEHEGVSLRIALQPDELKRAA